MPMNIKIPWSQRRKERLGISISGQEVNAACRQYKEKEERIIFKLGQISKQDFTRGQGKGLEITLVMQQNGNSHLRFILVTTTKINKKRNWKLREKLVIATKRKSISSVTTLAGFELKSNRIKLPRRSMVQLAQ